MSNWREQFNNAWYNGFITGCMAGALMAFTFLTIVNLIWEAVK